MKQKYVVSLSFCALLLLGLMAACGGSGGGGTTTVKSQNTSFMVLGQYRAANQLLQPMNSGTLVAGRFKSPPNPAATGSSYDWSATLGDGGWANVTGFAKDDSRLQTPQTMSIYIPNEAHCLSNPTTTSGSLDSYGGTVSFECAGFQAATAQPYEIDVTSPPASITLTGQYFATQYGTPRVQWYDEFGYLRVDQYASSYASDGTSLTLDTPSNIGSLYSGGYAIVVFPKQADGTYWSQAAAGVTLVGNPPTCPCNTESSCSSTCTQQCSGQPQQCYQACYNGCTSGVQQCRQNQCSTYGCCCSN